MLSKKQVERLEHVRKDLLKPDPKKITLEDLLMISLLYNTLEGSGKPFGNKEAAGPLYSLSYITKVIAEMQGNLVTQGKIFKKSLGNGKVKQINTEPLYLALTEMFKLLMFLIEAVNHYSARIGDLELDDFEEYKTPSSYLVGDLLRMALDRVALEKTFRNH